MAIMKSELIVTMRTVIWRPCRQIELDFVLMFDLPNPLTIVKWVDDAIDIWSSSLAFLLLFVFVVDDVVIGWWGWWWWGEGDEVLSATAVSSTSITCWSWCDFWCVQQSSVCDRVRLSWSFVNFSRFWTLNRSDEVLWFEDEKKKFVLKLNFWKC